MRLIVGEQDASIAEWAKIEIGRKRIACHESLAPKPLLLKFADGIDGRMADDLVEVRHPEERQLAGRCSQGPGDARTATAGPAKVEQQELLVVTALEHLEKRVVECGVELIGKRFGGI